MFLWFSFCFFALSNVNIALFISSSDMIPSKFVSIFNLLYSSDSMHIELLVFMKNWVIITKTIVKIRAVIMSLVPIQKIAKIRISLVMFLFMNISTDSPRFRSTCREPILSMIIIKPAKKVFLFNLLTMSFILFKRFENISFFMLIMR